VYSGLFDAVGSAINPPEFQQLIASARRRKRILRCLQQEFEMKRLVVALIFSGFVAAPALAAEMDFATVDADGDGSVTMEEASAAGWEWDVEQFEAADADGSGALEEEEFMAAVAE
jgi:hypothetical protein